MEKSISEQAKAKGPANTATKSKEGIYANSMAALRILVGGTVTERVMPARDGRPEATRYSRPALVTGGDLDIQFTISTYRADEVPQEGVHVYGTDVFQIGDYGNLKLNRYAHLLFVDSLNEEQKARFAKAQNPVQDLLGG